MQIKDTGSVWVSLWMAPLMERTDQVRTARMVVRSLMYCAYFATVLLLYRVYGLAPALSLTSLAPGALLLIEYPQLLGRCLTWILAKAVTGLNLHFDAIRLVPWRSDLLRTPASSPQDIVLITPLRHAYLLFSFQKKKKNEPQENDPEARGAEKASLRMWRGREKKTFCFVLFFFWEKIPVPTGGYRGGRHLAL